MNYRTKGANKKWLIIGAVAAVAGVLLYLKKKGKLHLGHK